MKLFLVHCGYYDQAVGAGIYENHVNFFVAAQDLADARARVKLNHLFGEKKMHVDGIEEVVAVNGHRVRLEEDLNLNGDTIIDRHRHRDLARKRSTPGPNVTIA